MRLPFVLCVCFALAIACAAPGQQQGASSPAPAAAATAPSRARPTDAVEWDQASDEIRCPTGTNLSLAAALAGKVHRVDSNEVQVLVDGTNAGALLVKASTKGKPLDQFFNDWAELVKLVSPSLPTKTIEAKAHMQSGHLLVEYFAPEQPEQHYELGYALVTRNGLACRLAALQPAPPGEPAPVALLDRVADAPGVQLAPHPPKPEDPAWALLRLLLDVGSRITLH